MISIVIPTLNEARRLPGLLAALAAEAEPHEVIVVDGHSTDGTAAQAQARAGGAGVVLAVAGGRGPQIRAGALAARGDIVLFLHADSRFPRGGLAAIRRALDARPRAPGGNFALTFDGDDPFSRWLDGFYAAIRVRGFYYGDSGIFARRAVLAALDAPRPLALMEDYDLARRLERAGPTVTLDRPGLVTASRRFRGRRKAAIVGGWFILHLLYHAGLPGRWLAWLYDSRRARQRPATGATLRNTP